LFVLPYLLLCREDSGQLEHDLREVFDAVRYMAKTGCPWRWVPGSPAALGRGLSADAPVARGGLL